MARLGGSPRPFGALLVTAALVGGVLGAPLAARAGATIHVPGDYATIQAAIDAASSGDTVLVGPGTYPEAILIDNKSVVVQSTGGPAVTTIDGTTSPTAATVWAFPGVSPVLRGFTITGGTSNVVWVAGDGYNGGDGLIEGNRIVDAPGARGVWAQYSDATIRGNLISNTGLGVLVNYPSSPKIIGNTITGNGGSWTGGGITAISSSPTIDANEIRNNSGGGIYLHDANPLVTNNLVTGNTSDKGGGVFVHVNPGQAGPTLVNNTIGGNTATYGADVYGSRIHLDHEVSEQRGGRSRRRTGVLLRVGLRRRPPRVHEQQRLEHGGTGVRRCLSSMDRQLREHLDRSQVCRSDPWAAAPPPGLGPDRCRDERRGARGRLRR